MYALTGLFLSLALFFASACGPGTYWEMTVTDPVLEVTAPGGEKAGLDLTGMGLTLGLGGDEAGQNGILRVSGHFGSETQSAAAFLRDGMATVILDGFDALLTAPLASGEDAAMPEIAVLRDGDGGTLRVTAEFGGQTFLLTGTLETEGEGAEWKIEARAEADLGGIARLNIVFEGQEAGSVLTGPLRAELTVSGGGSARLDCGLSLRTAPLEGYVNAALPEDMERIDINSLSEEDADRLQALLTTRLAANLLRVPGLMGLLRSE